jgi:hypothetical protein
MARRNRSRVDEDASISQVRLAQNCVTRNYGFIRVCLGVLQN